MLHEHILWAVLLAVIPVFLLLKWHPLYYYAAAGIGVGALFTVLFFQLRAPTKSSPETQGASRPRGFFHRARNFVINNPIMTYIQGEDQTPRIMELLSGHVMIGAAYDDSARGYPPRCHPSTHVKILEHLTAWFYNIKRANSLLWLSGPAGVGKSAIMQTFAESVKHFVASVFISRPNQRNNPNLIFTTIAYQLAVHIDAYRDYIVGRLSTNPHLVNKSIHVQFQVFITEPFGEKKIGVGELPVAILLDELDEVEGANFQRNIIRLITAFTHEHPDVPLVWIIASRPEPHISGTFDEVAIRGRYMSESVPIDSTDACRDVENFLRDSLGTVRHEFQHLPLGNWPEETALAKLASAASGLFIFAETAVRFIRDPDYANPIWQLELMLSAIDSMKGVSIGVWPFALLDNLYTEILSRIPPGLWPTTRLLLRWALFFRSADGLRNLHLGPQTQTLRGMITILQLDCHTTYAALTKCFSILDIPSWEMAHDQGLTFLHESFPDYLMDSERSGGFYIDANGIEDDILIVYLDLWHKHFGIDSNRNLVNEVDNETPGPTRVKPDQRLLSDITGIVLCQIVERHTLPKPVSTVWQRKRLECLDSFRKVNMISLCRSKYLNRGVPMNVNVTHKNLFWFVWSTFDAWQKFHHELRASGFLHQVSFKDSKLSYHDGETCNDEGWLYVGSCALKPIGELMFGMQRAPEPTEVFLSRSPDLPVLICGTMPEGRVALFKADAEGQGYFIVPYRA